MEWLTGFIASSVGKVTSWISGTANQLLDNVFGFCKALVQMFWDWIISFISNVLSSAASLLDFQGLGFSMGSLVATVWSWLMMINDFFPVVEVFAMVTVYVIAWGVMLLVNWALRLIPTVSGGAGGSA